MFSAQGVAHAGERLPLRQAGPVTGQLQLLRRVRLEPGAGCALHQPQDHGGPTPHDLVPGATARSAA